LEGRSWIVVVAPVPEYLISPGALVMVHTPDAGRPFKTMLPMAFVQEGCVTEPIFGGTGVNGWGLIITFADTGEVQPDSFVTVKV